MDTTDQARKHLLRHDILPAEVINFVANRLEEEQANYFIQARGALAGDPKFLFHFSLFKLVGGLSASAQLLLDPSKSGLLQGLAILAAAAAFTDSIKKLSIEEAVVCQSLWEQKTSSGQAVSSYHDLKLRLVAKTGEEQAVEKRLDSALASLERLQVVQRHLANETVELLDLMFVRKPRNLRWDQH
nr:hypothetical protein [uncultured Albidiferax sp.]